MSNADESLEITRKAFEAWISDPPYELNIDRYKAGTAWPGTYRFIEVDLAWRAWCEATEIAKKHEQR